MITGTDVSFYQDNPATPDRVNFDVMALAGAEFAIIRAGQNTWVDRDFKKNWQAAKGVLPRGSYWFYDSRADPKKQAALWVSTLAGDLGELPMFADFEDNYGGAWAGWKHWYTFLEEVKRLAPNKEIGIYTGYYYWIENMASKGIPSASLEYFKQYPLWIANYSVSKPLVPKPWTNWTLWQYTDKGDGKKYGVESLNIDLNYFNGDLYEFNIRFGLNGLPPKEEEQESKEMYQMTTIDAGTRIRNQPNTAGTELTRIGANITISGSELFTASVPLSNSSGVYQQVGDKWLKITYNGVTGWMAYIHMGKPICKDFKQISEPIPPPIPSEFTVTVKATGYKAVTVDLEPE